MKSYKIDLCTALFVALTAAKLLFPQQADALRQQVLAFLNRGDYTQLVQTMGERLTDGGWGQELAQAMGLLTGEEAGVQSAGREDETGVEVLAPLGTDAESGPEQAAESPDPASAGEEKSAAVSAFLALQSAYEEQGYALPDNVRADMPELPFTFSSPVAGTGSSGFGYRVHPILGEVKFHYGTDYAANSGDDVLAFADGTVYAAGTSPSYGNYMILHHEGGYSSVYAHLSAFVAQEGDTLRQGQRIARVGQTGVATGPHLHFELLLDGAYLNPEYYL